MAKSTASFLQEICVTLTSGQLSTAQSVARENLPFTPYGRKKRRITDAERVRIFLRDGFIDRYSGDPLVFPGVLRLLSHLLPDEFPYHPNWKTDACHPIYWQLYPTIDHLLPLAQGGADEPDNWVCTSMLHNSAKANWALDDLGWMLYPPGQCAEWDGLPRWFVEYTEMNPSVCKNQGICRWRSAAITCQKR